MTTTETTTAIRQQLKAKGWGPKQVSVRQLHAGSVKVTIRHAGVRKSEVEAIARPFESIDRDAFGEILCGGNLFVSVEYDDAAMAPLVDKILPLLPTEAGRVVEIVGWSVCLDDDDHYANDTYFRAWHGQHDAVGMRCWGRANTARQLAEKLIEG